MATVRVQANVSVYGLAVGDIADMDDEVDEVAALIEAGLLSPYSGPAAGEPVPGDPGVVEPVPADPAPVEPVPGEVVLPLTES